MPAVVELGSSGAGGIFCLYLGRSRTRFERFRISLEVYLYTRAVMMCSYFGTRDFAVICVIRVDEGNAESKGGIV